MKKNSGEAMSEKKSYKMVIVTVVLGAIATIATSLILDVIKDEPERMAEFTVMITVGNEPSFSGILILNRELSGKFTTGKETSPVTEVLFTVENTLSFVTNVNARKLNFSGFYSREDHTYRGIFLNAPGSWYAKQIK